MRKIFYVLFLVIALTSIAVVGCKDKETTAAKLNETAVTGSTTVLVDETVFPIVEDLAILFENEYKRVKLKLVSKPENEILKIIHENKGQIAIMSRSLDSSEISYFNNTKKVYPRITEFAVDAITFIGNKKAQDSTLTLNEVISIMKGEKTKGNKSLVFDNPNSSTVRELKKLAGVDTLPQENVFSVNSNKEVIKYVTEHEGAVGVLGVNWIFQPTEDLQPYLDKIQVLGVENVKVKEKNRFIKPNQTNIADGSYPVTRKLYLLNFQGSTGLGMGFASYIAGQQGQRIILKSGLIPSRFPTRKIELRSEIEKNK
ncbi:substrate-binding domain-containing protein [Flavobacterium sp. SM15]|uniref:PstS family phosphate ABC transporter substrate-binding protein n=1 Tax=Flavobacterium sp. SM15 TaxID=2908005 RepID=UPI001EDBCC31|nr:substrate-binding domain-containing protein [Flavobacterium sp. SM15]MCG2609892.1 substrate-binding domain-containing protein [Flavobacterium sp. SM15]